MLGDPFPIIVSMRRIFYSHAFRTFCIEIQYIYVSVILYVFRKNDSFGMLLNAWIKIPTLLLMVAIINKGIEK
jgi:hypothetical protein